MVFLQIVLHRQRSGQRAHAQQVVPAAVTGAALFHWLLFRHTGLLAQTGQGVKFAQEADDRAALTKGAAKGGGNAAQAGLYGKALILQGLGKQRACKGLVKPHLGVVPDLVAEPEQQLPLGIQGGKRPLLLGIHPKKPLSVYEDIMQNNFGLY